MHVSWFTSRLIMLCCIALCLIFSTNALAEDDLPLPRFVSIKPNEVNVRTGPGLRYQIKWLIKKQNLPLEVIAEFEQWRKIRDSEGDEGWLHRAMLSSKRSLLIIQPTILHASNNLDSSENLAQLEKGVIVLLKECTKTSCEVTTGDYRGWVDRNDIWGIYPQE